MGEQQHSGNVPVVPENVCVCFHVPLHKLAAFIRIEKPRVASQLSNCFGAGTGCGWCIPFLERLFEVMAEGGDPESALAISTEDYLESRRAWRAKINAERMKDVRDGEDAD